MTSSLPSYALSVDINYARENLKYKPINVMNNIKKLVLVSIASGYLNTRDIRPASVHYQDEQWDYLLQQMLQYPIIQFRDYINNIQTFYESDFIMYTMNHIDKYLETIYRYHKNKHLYFSVSFSGQDILTLSYVCLP